MTTPKDEPVVSETLTLIAETMRVPLDKTVTAEFTPRQKALLNELEAIDREAQQAEGKADREGSS